MSTGFFWSDHIFALTHSLTIARFLIRRKEAFFIYNFRMKFITLKRKIFVSCMSYFDDCAKVFKIHENFESVEKCFLRFILKREEGSCGKIILEHCRGHDTIIVKFKIYSFRKVDKRLLHKNFGFTMQIKYLECGLSNQ